MIASKEDSEIIKAAILTAVKNKKLEKKNIYIFGCTMYARNIRDVLRQNGYEITGIIDNNAQKTGKECLGVAVVFPQEIPTDDVVVIICSKYAYEMQEQLKRLGILEWLNIPISESVPSEDDSEESFKKCVDTVEKGIDIFEKIQRKYSDEHFMFLCPYPGTGDIYMACLYFRAYCEKHGIEKYIFAVIGGNCKRTAQLFDIKNIELITTEEKDALLRAWEFVGSERMPLKPLLYWGWRTKKYLYADHYPQITFHEMFLYDVYGLDKTAVKQLPEKKKDNIYAVELFREKQLTPGKTIIMAPYAGSFVSEMKTEEWEMLAQKLKDKGYDVCTNCNGTTEQPINGTVPIFFPYHEAISVLEYAGGFIALRSGLCDIISSAECKMVVLYESGFNAARYEYFSLKKMGLNLCVKEIVYSGKSTVKKIMSYYK